MYKTDNTKIGKHLEDLIKNSKFKNARQFSIEYLKLRDKPNPDDHQYEPPTEDIQKMQNRICQIKKGNKGIQIEDLPIFSELLQVSIEDILSAGTALVPATNRQTNYSIAYSKKPDEWESYIQRKDKLILNPDEYNKTAIDYALDAGNYRFLKYLMDKHYIWFVSDDKNTYLCNSFGAGTNIKPREVGNIDILNERMNMQDDLRIQMIALAIDAKDLPMLKALRAREIPFLYKVTPTPSQLMTEQQLPFTSNVKQMIENIAQCKDTAVLSYFFEEFEVESDLTKAKNTFVFPFASILLEKLIKENRIKECRNYLEISIKHNKKVRRQLENLIKQSIDEGKEFNTKLDIIYYNETNLKKSAWQYYYFFPDKDFVSYRMTSYFNNFEHFVTNVIHVTVSSKETEIQSLIDELNNTYQYFVNKTNIKEN